MKTLDMFASLQDAPIPDQIRRDIDQGALFFIGHSGGKDSQIMYLRLTELVPHDQIVVVHASLGAAEHKGVIEHIRSTIEHPLHVVEADRSFLEMVWRRGMWPDARNRLCTSTLKTGPIRKFVRQVMRERGATIAYNCTGIRAQESVNRAKKIPLAKHVALCTKTRTVYDWLPIFELSEDEVYDRIYAAGQRPHPAYGERGEKNTRLSCVLCVLANKNDLRNGAKSDARLYAEYVITEKVINHTMFTRSKTVGGVRTTLPVPLEEKTGVLAHPRLLEELEPIVRAKYAQQQIVAEATRRIPARSVA